MTKKRKTLRVLVLVHETLVPPEDTAGYSVQEIDEWRTEYDVTASLRALGHEVKVLGMGDNLAELRATIMDWKPDIAFNLLEEFQGIVTYDQYVVAFLELMRLPYTGCNPRGMMISTRCCRSRSWPITASAPRATRCCRASDAMPSRASSSSRCS
jgi:D-alanine-D-alanine ligase